MGQVKFNFDNHILDTDRRELRRGADLVAMCTAGEAGLIPRLKRVAQPGWRIARRLARTAGWNLT